MPIKDSLRYFSCYWKHSYGSLAKISVCWYYSQLKPSSVAKN